MSTYRCVCIYVYTASHSSKAETFIVILKVNDTECRVFSTLVLVLRLDVDYLALFRIE